jgi:hypothetical protein
MTTHDEYAKLRNKVKNINHYLDDGFIKMCEVQPDSSTRGHWYYKNINREQMFSNHRSWVYFIVDGETVMKVGETGNPLAIIKRNSPQPYYATTNRFGRLAYWQDSTDGNIKEYLYESVKKNQVSLWARRCDVIDRKIIIGGQERYTKTTFHKELELQYLDYMASKFYSPPLNVGRK